MDRTIIVGAILSFAVVASCDTGATGPSAAASFESAPVDAGMLVSTEDVAASVTGSAHFPAFPPDQCLIFNPGCPSPQGIGTRNMALHVLAFDDGAVRGAWQSTAGSAILHGTVDCMTIAPDGQSARLSGLVTNAKFTLFQAGTAFAMEVFDNGAGMSSTPDESTAIAVFRNLAPAVGRAFCETGAVPAGGALPPIPSEQGNVTIRVED